MSKDKKSKLDENIARIEASYYDPLNLSDHLRELGHDPNSFPSWESFDPLTKAIMEYNPDKQASIAGKRSSDLIRDFKLGEFYDLEELELEELFDEDSLDSISED